MIIDEDIRMLTASEYSAGSSSASEDSESSDISVVMRADLPPAFRDPTRRITLTVPPNVYIPFIPIPPSPYSSLWERHGELGSPRARSPQPGAR